MRRVMAFMVIGVLADTGLNAQMPERKELLAAPRFVEQGAQPSFKKFTEAQCRAELRVLATRSYAAFSYNTPEVRLELPKVSNSAYATVAFSPATLLDAKGKTVAFELEESGYMERTWASEIRFTSGDAAGPVAFARATGKVNVKYPAVVATHVITAQQPGPKALSVKLDGPYVSFIEDESAWPETTSPRQKPLRAYDAAGRQLEQHGNSETTTDDAGNSIKHVAFYGNVAKVEIDQVATWLELELPYDLKPAPLLPVGHEGEAPASER
jgi:hypothetical protein